jgi:hypothetical protein
MANYKELEGFSVQTLAADPDNPGWVGSIFYNSTEGVFKTVKPGGIAPVGTWASQVEIMSTVRDYGGMEQVELTSNHAIITSRRFYWNCFRLELIQQKHIMVLLGVK